MRALRSRLVGIAAALGLAAGGVLAAPPAPAAAGDPYTVTVGATGPWTNPDDTPASPYLDKDGTFYYQQAHALYGPDDSRQWNFYSGRDFDHATRSAAISDAGTNPDTTAFCNNSPTGASATRAPAGSGYAQRNYCDLAGVWVDPDTGDWYGLVHNEFTPQPFGDGIHFDAIDYAVSKDQGRSWTIQGHAITSPTSTTRGDTAAFPHETYSYGDGDPRLFADTASGYFYVFYGSRVVDKKGGWKADYAHVARAPMASKMAAGSWRKWYDGAWREPGVGGRESTMVPVSSPGDTGYVPPSKEYDPRRRGTADQQIEAGTMPPTSPLFVMNITYDAHLGLYIGEPESVDRSGSAPQRFYATADLATQKWRPIGDTGTYTNASWYRWFLDGANRTSANVVGRTFRSYCSYGCSGDSSAEYVDVTIEGPKHAPAPVRPGRAYRIASTGGRSLAQAGSASAATSATTSLPAASRSDRAAWTFTPNGDGSYRIANRATGGLLGVDSTATTQRAWGTRPTVTPAPHGGPTTGQQWFLLPGPSHGTHRLVNRYSGLVIGLSGHPGRRAETTPARSWTDTGGGAVGGGRSPAEQLLTLRPAR